MNIEKKRISDRQGTCILSAIGCSGKSLSVRRRIFTLIELLVVIAIIAILLRSKWPFFLLFSAVFAFSRFDEKLLNTQIPNVTSSMIAG
ncbi:MAG: prepilin-type N-terminal cleavage/methylation domain-containing protein [Lentisphaeria bacterium]|nr:prepilin-type N-terminal cleavage/methylation domain-containing protein [Lentisphaeria bacterium]